MNNNAHFCLHDYNEYLMKNNIPNIMKSILSSLIMIQPSNPQSFMINLLKSIQKGNQYAVKFDHFVKRVHPSTRPSRLQFIKPSQEIDKSPRYIESSKQEIYTSEIFQLTEIEND